MVVYMLFQSSPTGQRWTYLLTNRNMQELNDVNIYQNEDNLVRLDLVSFRFLKSVESRQLSRNTNIVKTFILVAHLHQGLCTWRVTSEPKILFFCVLNGFGFYLKI